MHEQDSAPDACSLPEPLDDLALLAAVDQEAGEEIAGHIATCPVCAARAAQFARLQRLLRSRLYRMFCPSSDELASFHEQSLPPDRSTALAEHVRTCPHCTRELAMLGDVLDPPDVICGLRFTIYD